MIMCMAEPAVCWVPALQMHRSAPYHFLILFFHYSWTFLSIYIRDHVKKSISAWTKQRQLDPNKVEQFFPVIGYNLPSGQELRCAVFG